ncbi:hypothetical protein JZX87_02835 [Agrobacterium sp. Ap1]|uniref:hypothetical protein n=1 Tax=Agrobacterium sp. Ap1 TaxID=2815337 RepID=UPI001A906FFF|nr:hypothetical protein [Agrobacterium sp. Ap1]MBO0140103.1 hypothetical protein [Agrobacterium sp. Ap1]
MAEVRNEEKLMGGQVGSKADLRDTARGGIRTLFSAINAIYWRYAGLISIFVLAGFAAVMVGLWHFRPIYNWDTLAYLATTALDRMGGDAAQIHAYAYSTVRDAVPAADFAVLTQVDPYRIRQFVDPNAFLSMVGMYEVKWLYVLLLKGLVPIFGPLAAFDVINGGALVILVVSIGLWLRSTQLSGYAPLVIGLLFLLQFQGFAVTQQPDFLGNSLLVAALLGYDRKRNLLGSVLLVAAVLVRPDQVAVAGVVMACAWFLRDRNALVFAVTFAFCLAIYIVISRSLHPTGWWPHFWFSTYQIQEDMTGFEPAFSLAVYFKAIALNIYRSLFLNTWLAAYVLALGCGGYLYFREVLTDRRRQVLLLAMLLAIAAKFTIFPLHDGRIYFSPLFVFFLIVFAGSQDRTRSPA